VYGHQPDQKLFDPIFPRARLQIVFRAGEKSAEFGNAQRRIFRKKYDATPKIIHSCG
jgi:hypothetical protein